MRDVCLSFDIDWAPEPVCRELFDLLEQAGVLATLFVTDEPDMAYPSQHEVALHPRVRDLDAAKDFTGALLRRHPEARGVRSHCLVTSAPLQFAWRDLGLTYTSNYLLHGQAGIRPIPMPQGVVEYPIFFMDMSWVRLHEARTLDVDPRPLLATEGMKVFDFHPVHLFLNTVSLAHYQEARGLLADPGRLAGCRREGPGIRRLFRDLLAELGPGDYTLRRLVRGREGTRGAGAGRPAPGVEGSPAGRGNS